MSSSKYFFLFLCMWLGLFSVVAQSDLKAEDLESYVDSSYVEDQFYAGMVYNVLFNSPSGISQNNFSNGFLVGFLKDIPLNSQRNVAVGLGLGYANNSYYYDMVASRVNGAVVYSKIGDDVAYKRSKIETHALEIPFEFRWRTSTASATKFWRVYGGFKVSYLFSRVSKFIGEQSKEVFANDDIRKWQYTAYVSAGYGTWNLYGGFCFVNLFEDGVQMRDTSETIQMGYFNAGLVFYIL